jgi:8-oxo-dGTP pyrophosphatase MutT (NUDIX family)
MPRHSLSAGAVVLNDEGKILLIKGPRRGWEFPGGIIELGETIQNGIIREVKEESGIDIEVIKFCGIYQNIKANVCATCWLAKAIGGEPQTSSESLEVGFSL